MAFIGFAAYTKLARFERAGAAALHNLPFGLNLGAATGTQEIRLIRRGGLTTPPMVGPFLGQQVLIPTL